LTRRASDNPIRLVFEIAGKPRSTDLTNVDLKSLMPTYVAAVRLDRVGPVVESRKAVPTSLFKP
jgi:hypothetical protein